MCTIGDQGGGTGSKVEEENKNILCQEGSFLM
jgi:hypothetical protein